MKTWIILVVAVAVAGVAAVGFTSLSSGTPVEAAPARRAPIREYIDEEGKTRLAETYLVTMPYNGRVEPIELVEGTPVTKGQVVARVSPLDIELGKATAQAIVERLKASITENDDTSVENTALQQTVSMVDSIDRMVEAAAARVKSGQAKLEYAERNLSRIQNLAKTSASTQDALEQARVQQVESNVNYQQDVLVLRSAEAMRAAMSLMPTMVRQYIQRKVLTHNVLAQQLEEANVQMREADRNAELGLMTSPVDGVVLERAVSNERQVSVGTVLLRIGRLDDLEIEADVLSSDVVRVKPGDQVEVHGPTIGAEAAQAQVARIYPAGFTKTSSLGVEQQRVKVIMKFAPDDLRRLREDGLGVNYRVRVRIYTAESSAALVIPRSALFRGAKNDWRVFVIRDGRAHLQAVKVGLSNDEAAEITSGLSENEQVILAPETNLAEGQSVSILDTGE
jgi:HlyD family secretion protein